MLFCLGLSVATKESSVAKLHIKEKRTPASHCDPNRFPVLSKLDPPTNAVLISSAVFYTADKKQDLSDALTETSQWGNVPCSHLKLVSCIDISQVLQFKYFY